MDRNAEIDQRSDAEVESFVYTVSHELNSPLISILGYIDLLQSEVGPSLPSEGRLYLDRIKVCSLHMQALVKDLLELSRVGRFETQPERLDLGALIQDIAVEVRALAPGASVEVSSDLPDIHMNPVRARQLFWNLMKNSITYAGRSEAKIKIFSTDDDEGFVTLSISDEGPGIAYEEREHVFDAFEGLKAFPESTGLGLTLCKRIVEAVGGRIWIHDSDQGTDVRISLPAADITI